MLRSACRSTSMQVTALSARIKIVRVLHLFSQPLPSDWPVSSRSQQVTATAMRRAGLLCQESWDPDRIHIASAVAKDRIKHTDRRRIDQPAPRVGQVQTRAKNLNRGEPPGSDRLTCREDRLASRREQLTRRARRHHQHHDAPATFAACPAAVQRSRKASRSR